MDGENGEHVDLSRIMPAGGLTAPKSHLERVCAQCAFATKEGRDRVCRLDPPRVFGFMVPVMVPGPRGMQQALEFRSYTQFPVVQDDQSCGRFEARGNRARNETV